MSSTTHTHVSVLPLEAVNCLVNNPDGVYVDGTFGRGGHSRLILERLSSSGVLIVIDKDPEAIAIATNLAQHHARVRVVQTSFANMQAAVNAEGFKAVDGVLLDLGVSSPQLDDPERGFSFSNDGPLDMRMAFDQGESAAQWIAQADEQEIAAVIYQYGEERFSRRMARAIVEARQKTPITRTMQLAEIVKAANPKWEKGKHPATRAFQGIRIHINRELSDLQDGLQAALDILKPEGRLSVISFHSLEDRIVKRFMRDQAKGDTNLPRGLPIMAGALNKTLRLVGKAQKPSQNEINENPRSRSAVLRVAEKL